MQTLTPGSILGHAVRRREDPRLVTGAGRYVDDIHPDGCLDLSVVRSTLAHAEIRGTTSRPRRPASSWEPVPLAHRELSSLFMGEP